MRSAPQKIRLGGSGVSGIHKAGRTLLAIVIAVLISAGASAAAPPTHPFGWDDMFAMVRLSDAQPSQDGRQVLCSGKSYDVSANKGTSQLLLVSADGRVQRWLTSDKKGASNGRWIPNGILFLSGRSGSPQIWRMPVSGGAPVQVTRLPVDVDGFEVSPDGRKILFWTGVYVDSKDLAGTARRLKERDLSKVKAYVFDRLFIRHWDTWNDGRRNHLFVMPVDGGKPVDLLAGMDQDAPTKPFGGSQEVAWSPDGRTVAFTSKPSKGEAWHTNSEIYVVPADGSAKPRAMTAENPATDTNPVFSPDGRRLAWLAMDRPGYESDRLHVVVADLKYGRSRSLTGKWDRSVSEIAWAPDGKSLYVTAEENARSKVFRLDAQTGQPHLLVDVGSNKDLRCTKSGRLFFMRSRMTHPNEVFTCDPASGKTARLSRVNDRRLASVRLSQPEEFWFDHDGFRIHGWLLRPVDFKADRKYPLAFMIHGGPQGNWSDDFHYRWNPQFYAGAGYAVLAIDFRGSTSYGQAFQDAIRGNWGTGPHSDLMAGLEHALGRHSFIDRGRMAALGASYGGYMVNWIAGQDHPFKCLVSHDGDFDTESSYYNTEELWFPEWEMGGPPWEKKEAYERNSPKQFVTRWKTPMLLIQGALDFRVVETEAFSTFNVLQRRGIPSRLLYFPDENHWVVKPQNSRLWHRTVLGWLDRWTHTRR